MLHLFAHILVKLNRQLEQVLHGEANGASWLDFTAVTGGYFVAAAVPHRHRLLRRGAMAAVALLAARAGHLRLQQLRLAKGIKLCDSPSSRAASFDPATLAKLPAVISTPLSPR